MNIVVLIGNLTRDVDLRYSQGEKSTAVAKFSIAVQRKFKQDGQPQADFINCTAFGNTALFVSKWFQKGSLILVTGSIQNRKYIDNQGNKRTSTEIMANKVDFCGGKSDSKPADRAQDEPQNYSQGNTDDFSVIDDSSDLPFD